MSKEDRIAKGYRERADGTWGPYSFSYEDPLVLWALVVYVIGYWVVYGKSQEKPVGHHLTRVRP